MPLTTWSWQPHYLNWHYKLLSLDPTYKFVCFSVILINKWKELMNIIYLLYQIWFCFHSSIQAKCFWCVSFMQKWKNIIKIKTPFRVAKTLINLIRTSFTLLDIFTNWFFIWLILRNFFACNHKNFNFIKEFFFEVQIDKLYKLVYSLRLYIVL